MLDEYAGVVSLPFDRDVPYLGGSDFPAFYGGTKLFLQEPSKAYNANSQLLAILDAKGYGQEHIEASSPWYRYYNPPAYSLLLSPLTLLSLQSAFAITLALNLVGLGLLLSVLSTLLGERRTLFYFVAGAVVTSIPVNYAFWHAQPTMFLAAFVGMALVAIEKRLPLRAGVYWALLFAKPHFLFLPTPFVLRRNPRSLLSLLAIGLVVALPFAIVGIDGIRDYVSLLVGRGASDVSDKSFAEAVLSWPGFLRGLTGEARPTDALVMSVLTVGFAALVYRRGWRSDCAPLALTLGMLLAVPHSHPQDWIMLAPVAALFLRSQFGRTLAISATLLLGIYAGLYIWSGQDRGNGATYWPTLFAFGLLVWTYALSELRARAIESRDVRIERGAELAA